MADKPVTEVVQVDAVLDGLSSPTSSDVYEALLPYGNDATIAAAAKRALDGGGSGLPEGWTQAGDPADVDTHGGGLELGAGRLSADYYAFNDVSATIHAELGNPLGLPAEKGSLWLDTNGLAWLKTGAGNNDWEQLGAGGGAGNFLVADFTFTEVATAGTYTATMVLPARSFLVDVGYWAEADWAADTMLINVGDSGGWWLQGQDIAGLAHYEWQSVAVQAGGTAAFVQPNQTGKTYAAPDTLTIEINTTILSPPVVATGLLRARAIYCTAPSPTAATFA